MRASGSPKERKKTEDFLEILLNFGDDCTNMKEIGAKEHVTFFLDFPPTITGWGTAKYGFLGLFMSIQSKILSEVT